MKPKRSNNQNNYQYGPRFMEHPPRNFLPPSAPYLEQIWPTYPPRSRFENFRYPPPHPPRHNMRLPVFHNNFPRAQRRFDCPQNEKIENHHNSYNRNKDFSNSQLGQDQNISTKQKIPLSHTNSNLIPSNNLNAVTINNEQTHSPPITTKNTEEDQKNIIATNVISNNITQDLLYSQCQHLQQPQQPQYIYAYSGINANNTFMLNMIPNVQYNSIPQTEHPMNIMNVQNFVMQPSYISVLPQQCALQQPSTYNNNNGIYSQFIYNHMETIQPDYKDLYLPTNQDVLNVNNKDMCDMEQITNDKSNDLKSDSVVNIEANLIEHIHDNISNNYLPAQYSLNPGSKAFIMHNTEKFMNNDTNNVDINEIIISQNGIDHDEGINYINESEDFRTSKLNQFQNEFSIDINNRNMNSNNVVYSTENLSANSMVNTCLDYVPKICTMNGFNQFHNMSHPANEINFVQLDERLLNNKDELYKAEISLKNAVNTICVSLEQPFFSELPSNKYNEPVEIKKDQIKPRKILNLGVSRPYKMAVEFFGSSSSTLKNRGMSENGEIDFEFGYSNMLDINDHHAKTNAIETSTENLVLKADLHCKPCIRIKEFGITLENMEINLDIEDELDIQCNNLSDNTNSNFEIHDNIFNDSTTNFFNNSRDTIITLCSVMSKEKDYSHVDNYESFEANLTHLVQDEELIERVDDMEMIETADDVFESCDNSFAHLANCKRCDSRKNSVDNSNRDNFVRQVCAGTTNQFKKSISEPNKFRKYSEASNIADTKERIKYNREFLYSLQFGNECLRKPQGLPHLPDIVHNQPISKKFESQPNSPHITETDSVQTKNLANYSELMTPYSFNMFMHHRPFYHPMMQRFHSPIIPPTYRACPKLASHPPAQPRKVIQVSLQTAVQLHTSDNAWKPANKSGEAKIEEEGNEDLLKKVRSILNKLTPQKFEILLGKVHELNINTEEKLTKCIDLIFEKAISEPNFSIAYANMAKCLINLKVPLSDGKAHEMVSFRKLLLNCCQREFEKDKLDETNLQTMQDEIEKAESEELRRLLIESRDEAVNQTKRRSLGNIRFIGELYKLRMLTDNIMIQCVDRLLLQSDDVDSVECLCRLLTTIGKDLDVDKLKKEVDKKMNELSNLLKTSISSRIRFMIEDVLELRLNNWIPRREDMKPKMLEQIHREIQNEEFLKKHCHDGVQRQNNEITQKQSGISIMSRQNSLSGDDNYRLVFTNNDGGHKLGYSLKYGTLSNGDHVLKHHNTNTNFENQFKADMTPHNGIVGDNMDTYKMKKHLVDNRLYSKEYNVNTNEIDNMPHRNHSISFSDGRFINSRFLNTRQMAGDGFNVRPNIIAQKGLCTRAQVPNGSLTPRRRSSIAQDRDLTKLGEQNSEWDHNTINKFTNITEERNAALAAVRDMSKSWTSGDNRIVTNTLTINKNLMRSETIDKRCMSDIHEYLTTGDSKEAIACIKEVVHMGGADDMSFLQMYMLCFINCCLDKNSKDRDRMVALLVHSINSKVFPSSVILKCLREVLSSASDICVDIPMVWTYLAEITSGLIVAQCINLPIIGELASFIEDQDMAVIFVAHVLKMLTLICGEKYVASIWLDSIADFVTFIPLNKLNAVFKKENMTWLFTKQCHDNQKDILLERHLTALSIHQKFSNQEIQDFVSNNSTTMNKLNMATVIFKAIISPVKKGSNGKEIGTMDLDLLKMRCDLLSCLLIDSVEFQVAFIKNILFHLQTSKIPDDVICGCLQLLLENKSISALSLRMFFDAEKQENLKENNFNSVATRFKKSLAHLLIS